VTVRNESTQIPKAQFAATFGVSEAQLERYFQQGMPHEKKGRRIMIPMPEGRVWYHKYLVEKGRREAMPQDLDEAKKRREMAMAEIAELDLVDRRCVTMLLEQYENAIDRAFDRVRARIQNLPPRLAGIVLGAQSIQEAQARIEPVVLEVMDELRAAEDVPIPPEDEELAA